MLLTIAVAVAGAKVTTWRELQQLNYAFPFEEYLKEYNKAYVEPEYSKRKHIYEVALQKIRAHNEDRGATWKMGLSPHTDRTDSEWQKMRGYKRSAGPAPGKLSAPVPEKDVSALPARLDWREHGVTSPVKNQGHCGSCWAFSATAVFESALAIATFPAPVKVLSPQALVDCATNPRECGGTGGCEGSTQWIGFNYTSLVGYPLESDYPYQASDQTCTIANKSIVAKNSGYLRLLANDYPSLMQAVNLGPVAISIAASWASYEEGVYNSSDCGTEINHAVVLEGYGTDNTTGLDYWLIRNSWGAEWGEAGYIRIQRFGSGKEPCGIDETPETGTACKGDPDTMKVCGLCGLMSDSSIPIGVTAVGN